MLSILKFWKIPIQTENLRYFEGQKKERKRKN